MGEGGGLREPVTAGGVQGRLGVLGDEVRLALDGRGEGEDGVVVRGGVPLPGALRGAQAFLGVGAGELVASGAQLGVRQVFEGAGFEGGGPRRPCGGEGPGAGAAGGGHLAEHEGGGGGTEEGGGIGAVQSAFEHASQRVRGEIEPSEQDGAHPVPVVPGDVGALRRARGRAAVGHGSGRRDARRARCRRAHPCRRPAGRLPATARGLGGGSSHAPGQGPGGDDGGSRRVGSRDPDAGGCQRGDGRCVGGGQGGQAGGGVTGGPGRVRRAQGGPGGGVRGRGGQQLRGEQERLAGVVDRAVGQQYGAAQQFRAAPHRRGLGGAAGQVDQAPGVGGAAGEEGMFGGGEVPPGPVRVVPGEVRRPGQGMVPEGGCRRARRIGRCRRQRVRQAGRRAGHGPGTVQQGEDSVRLRRRASQGAVRRTAVFGERAGVHRPAHQGAAEAQPALGAGQHLGQRPLRHGAARPLDEPGVGVLLPVARTAAAVVSNRSPHSPGRPGRRPPATPASTSASTSGRGSDRAPASWAGDSRWTDARSSAGLPSAAVTSSSRTAGSTAPSVASSTSSAASPGVSGPSRSTSSPVNSRSTGRCPATVSSSTAGRPDSRTRAAACPSAARDGASPQVGVVHAHEQWPVGGGRPQGVVQLAYTVRAEVSHRSVAEEAGGGLEERGAAATGFTGHDTDAAVGVQRVQQLGDLLLSRGRVSGHSRDLTYA